MCFILLPIPSKTLKAIETCPTLSKTHQAHSRASKHIKDITIHLSFSLKLSLASLASQSLPNATSESLPSPLCSTHFIQIIQRLPRIVDTYFTLFKLLKSPPVLKSLSLSPSLSSLLEVSPSLYFHIKLYYFKI